MQYTFKINPKLFRRIQYREKTFLLRNTNEGIQAGDNLVLFEWDDSAVNSTTTSPKGFTSATPLHFRAGYIEVLDTHSVIVSLVQVEPPINEVRILELPPAPAPVKPKKKKPRKP
jgi:hypothetical protein